MVPCWQEGADPHCPFWSQNTLLLPFKEYPELQKYSTEEPQLRGPRFGLEPPFWIVGGLPQAHTVKKVTHIYAL